MNEETVELHAAWSWDCPICGRERFERSVVEDLNREEKEEFLKAVGEMEEYETMPENEFLLIATIPTQVVCPYCKKVFEAKPQGHEEIEDH